MSVLLFHSFYVKPWFGCYRSNQI